MTKKTLHLLVIDPQNDFCDLPPDWLPRIAGQTAAPALPVTGAHADMLRLAALIRAAGDGLSAITLTLDAHQHIDIGHPTFWRQGDGSAVAPFTPIAAADLRAGRFLPRDDSARERVQRYLDALEAAGRYTHMVWPVHCEIGSWGHSLHPALHAACNDWEEAQGRNATKVLKGSNPWTEHYSAVQAEVPDPADAATGRNAQLIESLRAADLVFIAGEAASHCVKASTEHIAEAFGAAALGKLALITDCMSAVGGFEAQAAAFLADMRARGAHLVTAAEALDILRANA